MKKITRSDVAWFVFGLLAISITAFGMEYRLALIKVFERMLNHIEKENINQALQRDPFLALSGRVYRESVSACFDRESTEAIQTVFAKIQFPDRAAKAARVLSEKLVKEKKCVEVPILTYKVLEVMPTQLQWPLDRRLAGPDFDTEETKKPRMFGIARIQAKGFPILYKGVILPLMSM